MYEIYLMYTCTRLHDAFGGTCSQHVADNIQYYNFACGSVWVRNLDSDIKEGTQTEGVWEQGDYLDRRGVRCKSLEKAE
jgi:hypothetical protein